MLTTKRAFRGSRAWSAPAWLLLAALLLAAVPGAAAAQAGDRLWLRLEALPAPAAATLRARAGAIAGPAGTARAQLARRELADGLAALTGTQPPQSDRVERAGTLLLGTPAGSPEIARLELDLGDLGAEGYVIRDAVLDGRALTVIAGNDERGVLYGVFHYLRLAATGLPARLAVRERPRLALRVLDHWDNLDGSVERGYAGASLWDWWQLPGHVDPRYVDYARANASIGINGTVLNNVNADPLVLTPAWLDKVAALAEVFRPWGIRVYLSARFSAPIELGGLPGADPLDPAVAAWWQAKVAEIYRRIPDFGGFLVKANSEGQPGPQDYGRTHAEGANMLAAALAPYGGVVMWRAFVYADKPGEDRIKQAYAEFAPLDGQFAPNVLLQVKNGPLDFQPREPFNPLFGAMPKTPLMMEFQITKEYLGFATHLVYLGTLYAETLDADTRRRRHGARVADVIDGTLDGHTLTGMAGVANIGRGRRWSGSVFDQANWYAFGRLAWNPHASARVIAEEWVRQTWGGDPAVVGPVLEMMLASRETAVDYMTPLGLAHLMAEGHHYGPAPWDDQAPRADWNPVYYHRADRVGIGFDRGPGGSAAAAQYAPALAREFGTVERVPERYLLWFHHVRWDQRLASGHTLWETLVRHYDAGVAGVARMRATWAAVAPHVDVERAREVADFLAIQQREARWWRDASIAYFQSINGLPLPPGAAPPAHPLAYYQSLSFKYVPGYSAW